MKIIRIILWAVCFASLNIPASAQNPQLWGMCTYGGTMNKGTIFKVNGDGTGFSTIFSFDSITGSNPQGSLCLAPNNMLYGTANAGGSGNVGTVIKVNPSNNTVTKLLDFNFTNGAFPWGSFMLADNGKLYGGGINNLIELNPANDQITSLHTFNNATEGNGFTDRFIQSTLNGRLYGLLAYGGANSSGTIVSYNINTGQVIVEHHFAAANGKTPYGSLYEASNGMMYGMTRNGGPTDDGVLFMFNPANGSYTKLMDFNTTNGKWPWNSMIQVNSAKLYGLVSNGGSVGSGLVFSFDINTNVYNIEFNFNYMNTGALPWQSFIKASDSKLYATLGLGGPNGNGVVFKFDYNTNTYTLVHSFIQAEGQNPNCDLVEVGATSSVPFLSANNQSKLKVWPNPSDGNFNFSSPDITTKEIVFSLYDVNGKLIAQPLPVKNQNQLSLKVPAGIYRLNLISVNTQNSALILINK